MSNGSTFSNFFCDEAHIVFVGFFPRTKDTGRRLWTRVSPGVNVLMLFLYRRLDEHAANSLVRVLIQTPGRSSGRKRVYSQPPVYSDPIRSVGSA